VTLGERPAQTVLAADAAWPCACVGLHRPQPAEYERHHIHMASEQRSQGLALARLTDANEYHHGVDVTDEHGAYWVALCGNGHGIVHYLLRLYARDGRLPLGAQRLNPYCRLLAFEGHRRVLAHGGWGPAPAPPAAFTA
jgi:hypothetical protein